MDSLLGIKGANFAMLAADSTQLRGIFVLKDGVDKIFPIADNLMMAAVGNSGDATHFREFMKSNMAYYKIRNEYGLNTREASHFARKNLADFRGTLPNYKVNLFMAGYDEVHGSSLFFIDDMANGVTVNYGAHGYGSVLCGSIYERYWHKNISQNEAYGVFEKLACEFQKRFVANYKAFNVMLVDEDGVRNLDPILVNQ